MTEPNDAKVHEAGSISAPPSATRAAKRPILVVDDEPEMLFSLRNLLRREFEVVTAGSGAEGIEILQTQPVHVVMTDQRMPQMTGVQFLTQIKDEHPEAIRMIFTGYADISAVIDAINQGNVYRYVTKPWDPEDLVAALREAGRLYDLVAARRKLLKDLKGYEARCVAMAEAMRAGRLGTLNEAGTAEADVLASTGLELMRRVDQTLAAMPGR
jgi:DNA-binding NtrC family response regulator